MRAVFDARDDESGRTVTLKLVRPKLAASPSFREQFDESMRGVAALSHPNIAAVYDWGIARVGDLSTAYVVNEHLTGGSLRDMFDRGRRLSPSQALAVGLDVCRALDHAHRRRFVHTELSPAKIVFGDDRRLRVIDFGLARLLAASSWLQPDSVPTHVAWYSAPEQALGEPLDGRADVYALGLTLHEAVTGALPFKSDSTVAALSARIGKLMPVSADLGPLASVLERAGRPDPQERSTAAEFGKGLLQAAAKLPRPEPLPLLSTGLFDTPEEELRSPDDPTGGVSRPGETPSPLVLVPIDEPDQPSSEPEPELSPQREFSGALVDDLSDDIPAAAAVGDELVILPLDAGDDAGHRAGPDTSATAQTGVRDDTGRGPSSADRARVVAAPAAGIPLEDPARVARGGGARRARRTGLQRRHLPSQELPRARPHRHARRRGTQSDRPQRLGSRRPERAQRRAARGRRRHPHGARGGGRAGRGRAVPHGGQRGSAAA